MLGSLIRSNKWQWMARGKHPGLKDYFSVGADSPLLTAICDWIERGYRGLTERVDPAGRRIAWRFWVGGHKPGTLLCGIVRDSSDSVGRPYPLMILGIGELKGWEKAWDRLPLAFEKTWTQMEAIGARMSRDLKELQGEVARIVSPRLEPPGKDFGRSGGNASEIRRPTKGDTEDPQPQAGDNSGNGTFFMEIKCLLPGEEAFELVSLLEPLARSSGDVPKAVFLGGHPARPMVAIFRRPLQPHDFTRLWSV